MNDKTTIYLCVNALFGGHIDWCVPPRLSISLIAPHFRAIIEHTAAMLPIHSGTTKPKVSLQQNMVINNDLPAPDHKAIFHLCCPRFLGENWTNWTIFFLLWCRKLLEFFIVAALVIGQRMNDIRMVCANDTKTIIKMQVSNSAAVFSWLSRLWSAISMRIRWFKFFVVVVVASIASAQMRTERKCYSSIESVLYSHPQNINSSEFLLLSKTKISFKCHR